MEGAKAAAQNSAGAQMEGASGLRIDHLLEVDGLEVEGTLSH